jgi:phytoene dehydrogenase-like protein
MKKVTIIGGGLGGLTAGALLARDGYEVVLLEQHNVVGGCATTFKRKGGFICEVGLHEMEGVYNNPQIRSIFNKLNVYDNIDFVKPDEFFAVTTQSGTFVMPDDFHNAQNKLINYFPHEKTGIKKYFKLISDISKELQKLQDPSWHHYIFFPLLFPNILRYKNKTVSNVLDQIIKDDRLKLILNANVQYYNDTPKTLSFLLHSVAQNSYYSGGGWFIKGGSQTLSNYLSQIIKECNGKVITNANVVHCDKKKVTYNYNKEIHTLHTDIIISNISPKQTYKLFGEDYKETKEIANSLLTVYLGFRKNLKNVYGKKPYSHFIFDKINSVEDFNDMLKKDISYRGFVFVDYSQIDAGLCRDIDKSFGAMCWSDYIQEWENLDKDEYKSKKQHLINAALSKLEQYYPGIGSLVEYAEAGTSKTVRRYIKTPGGTAYGYKPTPHQFFRIPKVKSDKVDTLYFAGQWVMAGGFSPAIISGNLCHRAIVNR